MLQKELMQRAMKLKDLIYKAKGTDTFRMFYSRLNIDILYMEKLFRGEVNNFPHPEILKKIADASQGKVTYEELTRICGYDLRDLIGVDSNVILRRQIYYIDLGSDGVGSEQKGLRPCLIISNNTGNKYSSIVTVAPITTKIKNLPTHITLGMDCGLNRESQVLLEQQRAIAKERIKEYIGIVSEECMTKVDIAIKVSLGIYNDTDKLLETIKNIDESKMDVKTNKVIVLFKKALNFLLRKLMNKELQQMVA